MTIAQISSLCLTIILFSCYLLSSHSYSLQGNLLQDLEKNDTTFAQDVALWRLDIINTPVPIIYSQCEGTYLMGGYNILKQDGIFRRVYDNLPPHDMIYYSIYLTLIDQWYWNASVIIEFDAMDVGVGAFLFDHSTNFDRNYCGDPNTKDLQGLIMSGKAEHKGNTLTVSVSTLNHYDPSLRAYGFRDFTLHFTNKTKQDIKDACGNANLINPIPLKKCPCDLGQYKPSDSSPCQSCDPSCATCLGPLPSQCLKCASDAFFDGTECTACHSSCLTCSGAREDQCLECPPSFFLFEGNRCITQCNPPLIQGTGTPLTCSFPCSANQFVTPDGICKDTCEFTHQTIESHGRKFCNDYCPSGFNFVPPTSSQAGACVVSCPSGTTQDASAPYCHRCQDSLCAECPINNGAICNTCQTNAVLDIDGVCKGCTAMEITYMNPSTSGHQYKVQLFPSSCDLDPQAVQQILSLTPASRQSLPSASFQASRKASNTYTVTLNFQESVLEQLQLDITLNTLVGTITVPKKLVPSEALLAVAELAPAAQVILTSAVGASFAGALAVGSTASIWSMISFQQFVGYFMYLNIDFPFQLEIFMSILGSSAWGFLPNPLDSLTESLKTDMLGNQNGDDDEYEPPQRFAKNDMTSFFIENGGSIIATNLAMHFALYLLIVLKKIRKSEHSILKSIRTNLKWNVLVRAFLENGVPLLLAICLQMRTISLENAYIGISSVTAFIALIYFAIMFIFIAKYLYTHSIKDLKIEENQQLFGTLNEGIELKKSGSKYYHLLIFARGMVLVLLIVFCQDIPFFQIIPLILMNAGLIYYLFYGADFEDKYLGMINKVKETLIMVGETLVLGLNFKNGSETHYETLGWLAVVCFSSSLLIETIYMIVVQVKNFKQTKKKIVEIWNAVWKWIKQWKARRRNQVRRGNRRYDQTQQDETTTEMIPATEADVVRAE